MHKNAYLSGKGFMHQVKCHKLCGQCSSRSVCASAMSDLRATLSAYLQIDRLVENYLISFFDKVQLR